MIARLFEFRDLDHFELADTHKELRGLNLEEEARKNNWLENTVTVLTDDDVMGFVAMSHFEQGIYVSYLVGTKAIENPVSMARASMRGIQFMHETQNIDLVYAEAKPGAPRRFLEFLGFTQRDDGVFEHGKFVT
jgi:hypothetical protein